MGERKVLNKYYPPDFVPPPRMRRQQQQQQQKKKNNCRMMLPMSVRCNTCGNFMSRGTKFNTRKEDVNGEKKTYLGIQIFRFYFNCKTCCAEFTIITDPRNDDYSVETSATRNFEPWRRGADEEDDVKVAAVSSLEKRTLDSKKEMDRLVTLEEIKSIKSMHAAVSVDALLKATVMKRLRRTGTDDVNKLKEEKDLEQEQKDEELIRSTTFQGSRKFGPRIHDTENIETMLINPKRAKTTPSSGDASDGNKQKIIFRSSSVAISVVKKKPLIASTVQDQVKEENNQRAPAKEDKGTGLQFLLQNYEDDE